MREIMYCGPVFLHNMYPFERYMGILKHYVINDIDPRPAFSKVIHPRRWLPFAQTTCPTNSLLVFLVLAMRGDLPE
jgi:hypothetical protein